MQQFAEKRFKLTSILRNSTDAQIQSIVMILISAIYIFIYMISHFVKNKFSYDYKPKMIASASFRLIIYTFMAIYGITNLRNKTWVYVPNSWNESLLGAGSNSICMGARLHYQFELCIYYFQLCLIFTDKKNKDFINLLIHHLITLFLIKYSYFLGIVRVGQVIMVLHDIADPFLELARICVKIKNTRIANISFCVFTTIFFSTRILFFPVYCVLPFSAHAFSKSIQTIRHPVTYKTLSICLYILYGLNIIWFFYIIRLLFMIVTKNQPVKDLTEKSSDDGSIAPK